MVLSPFGDSIFVPYNFSVHKIDALSGAVEFATDPSLYHTFVALNEGAGLFFAAGMDVHAYQSNIVGPVGLVTNSANGGTSAAIQLAYGIATLVASVVFLGV